MIIIDPSKDVNEGVIRAMLCRFGFDVDYAGCLRVQDSLGCWVDVCYEVDGPDSDLVMITLDSIIQSCNHRGI